MSHPRPTLRRLFRQSLGAWLLGKDMAVKFSAEPMNAEPETAAETSASAGAGAVYSAFIKGLLDYEQTRKAGLESKAGLAISSSGALATLLFGLVAVITGAKNFMLPSTAHGWLGAAVVLFVVAAGLAVVASVIPVPYGTVEFDATLLEKVWDNPASVASRFVAAGQLEQIKIARSRNQLKACLVIASGSCELSALVMLAVAVMLIIGSS